MSDFTFSQSSLQDYVDCPRRFELRYRLKIQWPGFVPDEPDEIQSSILLGNRFHLLCQQFFTGIPEDMIRQSIDDEILLEWWDNFLAWQQIYLGGGQFFPEITLHACIAGRQVIAKYDLLQVCETGVNIFDWKTSLRRQPKTWLDKKIQTTLYPLMLCLSNRKFLSDNLSLSPENIEMMYWFAAHPQEPEIYPYSRSQFDQDLLRISNLVQEISSLSAGSFEKTENEKHCRFCTYRSLCERYPASIMSAAEDDFSMENTLEEIAAGLESRLNEIQEI